MRPALDSVQEQVNIPGVTIFVIKLIEIIHVSPWTLSHMDANSFLVLDLDSIEI
jgi:hypothetical protein